MSENSEIQTRGGIDSLVSENEYVEPIEEEAENSVQSDSSLDNDDEYIEDPEKRAEYEVNREIRRKKSKRKDKVCSAACIALGIIGSGLLGLGTATACGLYDIDAQAFAITVPNGTDPDNVDVSTDSDGNIHVDVDDPSDETSEPDDNKSDADVNPDDTNPDGSGTDDKNSDDSDDVNDNNDKSEDTKPDEKPETSKPENIPGTGEIPVERITNLMENELLKAQNNRITAGQSMYLDSDMCIVITEGISVENIAQMTGFSEKFILSYNSDVDCCLIGSLVRIPNI